MLPLLEDTALAIWALSSILFVGVAGLKICRARLAGLELLSFSAGFGVLIHGLIGLTIALAPAKQVTARVLFLVIWGAAAAGLWWRRTGGSDSRGKLPGWREAGVRPTVAILVFFIVSCVSLTHLQIRFPRVLPDGPYVFKEHTLPVKLQVLTGGLPVDNYIPFVVQEYFLRDISFVREHPIVPGQEVSNRTILMTLATTPFRAALESPPRYETPLPRFDYVTQTWPDAGVFMEGNGFRRFLAVGIVLNALVLLGAALVISAHGPRTLLIPGLLLLVTSPFYLSQTIFTWPKSLAAFFLLLALHALARRKSSIWVAATGALAYHSHPYAAVFLLGFGCHYAARALWKRDRSEWRQLAYFGVTAGLALAPWFVWTRLVLPLPSDLIAQNLAGRGIDSLPGHLWVRVVNLGEAFVPGMLSVASLEAVSLFRAAIMCLPGLLGLVVLPAYAGCVLCLRSHRVFVVYGVLLPAVLLAIPFSFRGAPLTLLAYHSIGVCLLLLGLMVLARAGRAIAIAVIAAQVLLQLGLLVSYGHALRAKFSSHGPFYRLLDHYPEMRDAPHPVNFRVAIAIGQDTREAIWVEPPALLTYRQVQLPPGVIHFRCRVAIHPHVWPEGNADGAEFILEVRPAEGGAATTAVQRVWSAAVDPFHHAEQRAWVTVDVDLSAFAGRTVDLILTNGPGPANNAYADWCLWADPELVSLPAPGSH